MIVYTLLINLVISRVVQCVTAGGALQLGGPTEICNHKEAPLDRCSRQEIQKWTYVARVRKKLPSQTTPWNATYVRHGNTSRGPTLAENAYEIYKSYDLRIDL